MATSPSKVKDGEVEPYSYAWWIQQVERDEKRLRDQWWNYADKIVKKYKDKREGEQEVFRLVQALAILQEEGGESQNQDDFGDLRGLILNWTQLHPPRSPESFDRKSRDFREQKLEKIKPIERPQKALVEVEIEESDRDHRTRANSKP